MWPMIKYKFLSVTSFAWAFFLSGLFSIQAFAEEEINQRQWVQKFEELKTRVLDLTKENDQLMAEYNSLRESAGHWQEKINQQISGNKAAEEKLQMARQAEGKNEPGQMRRQLETKQNEVLARKKEILQLDRKISVLEKKVQYKKFLASGPKPVALDSSTAIIKPAAPVPPPPAPDPGKEEAQMKELEELKVKLADNQNKEQSLNQELGQLEQQGASIPSEEQLKALEEENRHLKEQIASLEEKRLIPKAPSVSVRVESKEPDPLKGKYALMIQQKETLASKIAELESSLNAVQDPYLPSSWEEEKKKFLNEILETDKENQALREQAIQLKENTVVLEDKINNIEQRIKWKSMIKDKDKIKRKYR